MPALTSAAELSRLHRFGWFFTQLQGEKEMVFLTGSYHVCRSLQLDEETSVSILSEAESRSGYSEWR
jgi:hypothetical protein